jgi:FKBP-type peptidyl-prolyl cis-trans isomerase 2
LTARIENLKKVTLLLNVGGAPESLDGTGSPVPFAFIYGVASAGLCPFESALYEKTVGERVELTVPAAEAQEFFGHLLLPLRQLLALQIMPHTLVLQVEVTAVHDADNREIVQSLAKAGSGCGGSCGCGC